MSMDKIYSFFVNVALAVGEEGRDTKLPNPLEGIGNDIPSLVDKIATELIILATPVVIIMVLIGGYQILFAAGDPKKFETGRNTILYAAIGLVVVLIAKGVTSIIKSVLGLPAN